VELGDLWYSWDLPQRKAAVNCVVVVTVGVATRKGPGVFDADRVKLDWRHDWPAT
jgi:hypothetical protein